MPVAEHDRRTRAGRGSLPQCTDLADRQGFKPPPPFIRASPDSTIGSNVHRCRRSRILNPTGTSRSTFRTATEHPRALDCSRQHTWPRSQPRAGIWPWLNHACARVPDQRIAWGSRPMWHGSLPQLFHEHTDAYIKPMHATHCSTTWGIPSHDADRPPQRPAQASSRHCHHQRIPTRTVPTIRDNVPYAHPVV